MTLKNAKKSLDRIVKKVSKTQDAREFLLKNTREIIVLCSRTIISIHKNDLKNARLNLAKAESILRIYKKKHAQDLQRYFLTAEQEFVEASSLIAIVDKKEIPSQEKLDVMSESYILGLMDCIGELKRMVFDKIRVGKIDEATRIFDIMQDLFLMLYPFSMYDKVIKEARRKIDVNRMLVEDVRAAITEEQRRSELVKSIERLKL